MGTQNYSQVMQAYVDIYLGIVIHANNVYTLTMMVNRP